MRHFYSFLALVGLCMLGSVPSLAQCDNTFHFSVASPLCSGTIATVNLYATKLGVTYQAFVGKDSVSAPAQGNGKDTTIFLPSSSFHVGNNVIRFKQLGCSISQQPKDTAIVLINEFPNPLAQGVRGYPM